MVCSPTHEQLVNTRVYYVHTQVIHSLLVSDRFIICVGEKCTYVQQASCLPVCAQTGVCIHCDHVHCMSAMCVSVQVHA